MDAQSQEVLAGVVTDVVREIRDGDVPQGESRRDRHHVQALA